MVLLNSENSVKDGRGLTEIIDMGTFNNMFFMVSDDFTTLLLHRVVLLYHFMPSYWSIELLSEISRHKSG